MLSTVAGWSGLFLVLGSLLAGRSPSPASIVASLGYFAIRACHRGFVENPLARALLLAGAGIFWLWAFFAMVLARVEEGRVWRIPVAVLGVLLDLGTEELPTGTW